MKTLLIIFASLVLAINARAQGSINIVGYYNLGISPGYNLIANQLSFSNNTLNAIFNPTTPVGSTFTRWDAVAQQFLPVSTYTASGWTINYSLNFGEGGILSSPISWTNTFVGEVSPALDPNTMTYNWHPNYPNGLQLLSSPVPFTGPMDSMFTNVVGRLPQEGVWVAILNPATQAYIITTFHNGLGWDNGDPALSYGQSAWFDLGAGLPASLSSIPVLVPEPSTAILTIAGIATFLFRRRRRAR